MESFSDALFGKGKSIFTPRKKNSKSPTPLPAPPPPPGECDPSEGDGPPKPPPPEPARLLHESDILRGEEVAEMEQKLPTTLRGYNWKLLYSLQAHGANFGTFYARCQFEARTLVVAQTGSGEVVGGYSNSVWRPGVEYYGTGQSFLFSIDKNRRKKKVEEIPITGDLITVRHGEIRPFTPGDIPTVRAMVRPAKCDKLDDQGRRLGENGRPILQARGRVADIIPDEVDPPCKIETYPWTGANNYFIMCSEQSMAMGGGGGSFGLFVDEDFSRGSSGPSETYGNPQLATTSEFDIVNFECWGFTTHDSRDECEAEDDARLRRPVVHVHAPARL